MSIKFPIFVDEAFVGCFQPAIPDRLYHGDRSAVSSSILKLFDKSAAAVESYYLDQDPEDDAEHFRLGRALHAAVLEPGRFTEMLVREPEFKGVGSRKEKAAWHARQSSGSIVMNEKMFLQTEGMLNSILSHSTSIPMLGLKNCQAELTGYYRDPATGILCKIRPDLWNADLGILVDVKTCLDSSPRVFSRKIFEYKYHLSMAMYSEGIFRITGKKPEFQIFIAVEKKPPYECAVYICNERMIQKGYEEYHIAMQKLAVCLQENKWPHRQTMSEDIDLPEWAYSKNESVELY